MTGWVVVGRPMRSVVQRVRYARVAVDGETIASIGRGLCALVGVGGEDTESDAVQLADRLVDLRIFSDPEGRMNLSLADLGGSLLAVSQFTLYGDTRRGRRPSFICAKPGEAAKVLFDRCCQRARERGIDVQTGRFGAHMEVELLNDGPVTLLVDTERRF